MPIATSVGLRNDGRVYVGGAFGFSASNVLDLVGRLTADGRADPDFNAPWDRDWLEVTPDKNWVHTVAVQGNRILVGGKFSDVNGSPRGNLARFNSDGTLDSLFRASTGIDGPVKAIVVQPDGNILLGGEFTRLGGIPRNGVARLIGEAIEHMELFGSRRSAGNFQTGILTTEGSQYFLESKSELDSAQWTEVQRVTGDGLIKILIDRTAGETQKFYRVRVQ